MHISKKGIRALGIAESYSGREQSVICGVAMRKDLRIDGVGYGTVTVGGTDATDSILSLVRKLKRSDINLLLLGGCVISWYNIIDPLRLLPGTEPASYMCYLRGIRRSAGGY